MKIQQKRLKFKPITIDFTSEEEAKAFINIIDCAYEYMNDKCIKDDTRQLCVKLCNSLNEINIPSCCNPE